MAYRRRLARRPPPHRRPSLPATQWTTVLVAILGSSTLSLVASTLVATRDARLAATAAVVAARDQGTGAELMQFRRALLLQDLKTYNETCASLLSAMYSPPANRRWVLERSTRVSTTARLIAGLNRPGMTDKTQAFMDAALRWYDTQSKTTATSDQVAARDAELRFALLELSWAVQAAAEDRAAGVTVLPE